MTGSNDNPCHRLPIIDCKRPPNPEEKEALQLAIAYGQEIGADLVLGTDPDLLHLYPWHESLPNIRSFPHSPSQIHGHAAFQNQSSFPQYT